MNITPLRTAFVLATSLLATNAALACRFTPLEWQQTVEQSSIQAALGQRKHLTWVRDQNRNFIDDEIERLHKSDELVDIIVDFNDCLTYEEILRLLDGFGSIRYIGKLVTFVMLDKVRFEEVKKLSTLPQVAMIELREEMQIMNDISSRTVQSRPSNTFSTNTASDAGFTGAGVNIAILDTGVDDGHEQFTGKFVAGFNALIFEDTDLNGIDDSCQPAPLGNGVCTDADDEPANGTNNPDDDHSHGSHVAGIALGQGAAGRTCGTPNDGSTPTNCAGVAPGAGLVDIKVCNSSGGCPDADVAEALDWLGLNAGAFGIRVANLSFGGCSNDDGTSAQAQQVNYVASLGVTMAVAHGNAPNCGVAAGTVLTASPGSASYAMTVGGTDDRDTIERTDDTNYSGFLMGPRNDWNAATPNLLALKPDLSAPGQSIRSAQFNSTTNYFTQSGTSMATPQVAGATAVLLEIQPSMGPGSAEDLLKTSADTSLNTAAFPANDPNWDTALGAGMLNLWPAVNSIAATDIGFPTCASPPANPGQPCGLSGGLPAWNNTVDISTASPPQVGVANQLIADVTNNGPSAATVLVNFGVYVFAAGNNQFFHVGTQQVMVPAGGTVSVSQPWTPASANHQCAQISIDYGSDTDFDNNVTQRNLSVAPSVFEVRVENPFPVPARFFVEVKSDRDGWQCEVAEDRFTLHPYRDCPRNVEVTFDAPADAAVGDRAQCDVGIWGVREDTNERELVGGVTVQTFVPKPCRIIGWVRDEAGEPVEGAEILVSGRREERRATSDQDGAISLYAEPYGPVTIEVRNRRQRYEPQRTRLYCGIGTLELVLGKEQLIIKTDRRQNDWFWDQQLATGFNLKR